MFPPGLPGIALVLLRVAVASTVLLHGYVRHEELPAWQLAALLLLATLLMVGLFTPILATLAMAVQFMSAVVVTPPNRILVGILILNALALALLGPGAYSLDARRFGRRVVNLSSDEDG